MQYDLRAEANECKQQKSNEVIVQNELYEKYDKKSYRRFKPRKFDNTIYISDHVRRTCQ